MNNYDYLKGFVTRKLGEKTELIKMQASIDAGSSETRIHTWSNNPQSGHINSVDSAYSIVTESISHINSQSDTLYDNLEIRMTDITDDKVDKVFEDITIVKGGLFEDLRLPAAKTSSNIGKGNQDTTYINAIANLAIRIYTMSVSRDINPVCVLVELSMALPQEDIISAKRQEEIKEKLHGYYKVSLPRMDFNVEIAISDETIFLFDEAQAALGYWKVSNKVDTSKYNGVLIIDAGGRSVDLSLMLKGRVISKGSYTGKFGGQKFVDLIIDKYINDTGNDMPSKDMIYNALDTGMLQDGNSLIDITKYIGSAKEEITKSIMSDIDSLLDMNEVRMNQLNLVVCAGRLMGESHNPSTSVPSMSTYIEREVKKISPNTMVGQIDDVNALVKGLSLARYAYDKKNAKK